MPVVNSHHRDLPEKCYKNEEPFLFYCPFRNLSYLQKEAHHFTFSQGRNVLISQPEPQRVALQQSVGRSTSAFGILRALRSIESFGCQTIV